MIPQDVATAEVELIVSAVPTPVLVADYTPIIERFEGMTPEAIRTLLIEDDEVFTEILGLPRAIAASPEWVRLYGSPLSPEPPDLTDRHFTRASYPELHRALIEQFTAPFFGTTSIISEHTAPTIFGDVVVRSHWKALTDSEGTHWDRIVIVDLDVTDLRDAQKSMEALLEVKEELVKSKDQLIASVAHEIRTPLSSIVGFAQLLRDSSDLNDDERNEMLELLVQQSADITNIVDDLLVVAKTNLGRLEISSVPVDLRAQAAQAVESLDVGSTRVIELPSATVRCVGDPSRVRQIVRNLVSNAFKYGGGEIWVETQTRGDVGVLRVCDNGDGIPENYRKSVFDAYDRGGQTSGSTPSLGLGLHISLNLAHRMGGDLTYAYENASSVFELTLPLASARSEDLVPGPRPS